MNTIANIPRVVVTTQCNGKSTILTDGRADNVSEHVPKLIISDLWATDTMPVDLSKSVSVENTLFPNTPTNGSYLRYVSIPPDSQANFNKTQTSSSETHPLMHKTNTLDYIVILSGELYLILEDTETLLKPGDIVIQRATNHAWSNRSNKPCIQLAILLDANPTPAPSS